MKLTFKNTLKSTVLGLAVGLLMGCGAGNRNIPMQDAFWQNQNQKITVATFKLPEPCVHQVGGQGLLDVAITSVANKALNTKLKQIDLKWCDEMPQHFVKGLKDKRKHATLYSTKLNSRKQDCLGILTETDGDLLLTLELRAVGARREYSGFIPRGAPEAYCVLVGELVDPKDKKVWWHHETEVLQKVQGEWDQPPNFPNFSAALECAITEAKQELLDSFFCGR